MKISTTQLRTAFVALALVLSGIPAVSSQTTSGQSLSSTEISKRVLPSLVSLTTENVDGHPGSVATGFFLGSGVIVTDFRVVKDAFKIQATSPGEDAVDLIIVAVDERRTLALLKMVRDPAHANDSANGLKLQKKIEWTDATERPRSGDEVYLFSTPLNGGGMVLTGRIDELREEAGTTFFHLAGSFGPDSIGSPVLDVHGNLIGMVVARHSDGGGPSLVLPADQIGECGSTSDANSRRGVGVGGATAGGVPGGIVGGVPGGIPRDPVKRTTGEADASAPTVVGTSQPIRKSGGVLQGSAVRRSQPLYPPLAKAARVSGAVVVEVTVDEEGDVISARAVSGHPLMKDCAVAAARGWKFKPTSLSGTPVKVIGTITFNFTMGDEPARPDGPPNSSEQAAQPGSGVGGAVIEAAATNVDSRPIALNAPRPNYTDLARSNHTEGIIVVRALVGSDGLIRRTVIAKGLPDGLNEEAIRAAKQLRFKPAMKGGQPVAFWQTLEIEFNFGK